ncbi:MAG TPA: YfbM family protein [Polyangia bacterium]|jgi:hypothetical protein|nr:YfbM family protein [Polyangia bacterium]
MGALGVHLALTSDQERRLLAAATSDPDPDSRVREVVHEIAEAWDRAWLQENDKAWDAIHRCLTDGALEYDNGDYPLNRCILGGQRLYYRADQIIVFVPGEEVVDVAAGLAAVDQADLRRRYQSLDPAGYRWKSDDDFAYTWEWFDPLKPFWARAAAAGRSVLFSAGQ